MMTLVYTDNTVGMIITVYRGTSSIAKTTSRRIYDFKDIEKHKNVKMLKLNGLPFGFCVKLFFRILAHTRTDTYADQVSLFVSPYTNL